MSLITLAITPGDFEGIGPEVTRKALDLLSTELKNIKIIIFSKKFNVNKKLYIEFIEPPQNKSFAYQSGWAIKAATSFVLKNKKTTALITGPISKERLNKAGFHYVGHTDFLAELTNSKEVTMVLANDWFRVALVTNHCALKKVSEKITKKIVSKKIEQVALFCKTTLKKKKPTIAVLSLNPHAGENGLLGNEEKNAIIPGMQASLKKLKNSITLTGPHPADSFFAIEKQRVIAGKGHDFIIAQYHDQGLIPIKLSDFSNALNLTLGLPFIRTSVDHGTAFDIAGKNKADSSSMVYAIRKAIQYL